MIGWLVGLREECYAASGGGAARDEVKLEQGCRWKRRKPKGGSWRGALGFVVAGWGCVGWMWVWAGRVLGRKRWCGILDRKMRALEEAALRERR